MTSSPRSLLGLSVALTLAVAAIAIALALQVPRTGWQLAPATDGRDGLVITQAGSLTGPALRGDRVVAFDAAGVRIPATPDLLVEDPDGLATFDEYNRFMANQRTLAAALAKGHLSLMTEDGHRTPMTAIPRTLADLPLLFWLQVLFGTGGMLTGALVLAGRPRDTATRLYAFTGLGFLVFAPAAAVYSTRELILDGDLFRLLSLANHFGALLFTASLTSLLWTYPVRLRGAPVVAICYLAALAAWLADVAQLGDSNTLSPITVLTIFAFSFVFAGMQWWKTRGAPAERAALRWFLLSIYLATGLFAAVILVPNALGVPPPASQGVMFGAFLIMYWGLALGIIRYRLFQLERWWRAIRGWFIGGIAVVLVDIFLISTLALSDALALTLAVAIVGWLYFPVRQWAWSRFTAPRARPLSQWLPDVLPMLIGPAGGGSHEEQIRARWPDALSAVFSPLSIEGTPGAIAQATIAEDGLALVVPDVRDTRQHLLLRHAGSGERLFTRDDLDALASLQELFELALERLRARDVGARLERERIRRDIHDDIGARLLTLLHRSPAENQPLVREAIDDLRVLVRSLEYDALPVGEALDGWQAEARKRCEHAGVSLDWQHEAIREDTLLGARQIANLTRVVREGISNALRHARPARIEVRVRQDARGQLTIRIHNDGQVAPLAQWPEGRGRQILRNRLAEIGGSAAWDTGDGCTLVIEVPPRTPDEGA